MRAPATARPSSRNGVAHPQSYMTAARMGAGALSSSPAGSVASVSSRARGNTSPTKRRVKKDFPVEEPPPQQQDNEANINVVVRCRGRSEREIRENSGVVVSTPGGLRGKEISLSMGPLALSNKTYTFDRVFGPEANQNMIYDNVVAPMLEEVSIPYYRIEPFSLLWQVLMGFLSRCFLDIIVLSLLMDRRGLERLIPCLVI